MAKFSSYFIEIEWWQSFHYIYQLHCIWQSLVFEVITYSLCNTWFVLWYIGLAIWYTIMLRIYVHHGAPFCALTVKRHCLPLTRLPRVAGGAPAVNHKATAIWLALRILAGNEHCNSCDGNMVSEYIFSFFMATYEWMHPKYVCRIFNYLFCIHAKFFYIIKIVLCQQSQQITIPYHRVEFCNVTDWPRWQKFENNYDI